MLFQGEKLTILDIKNAALGVINSASLIVHRIGLGLAGAKNLLGKHAVKQVDRLLSNEKFVPWNCYAYYVPYVVGARKEIVVAMDWTDFDADQQATITISLVTSHGRATPLIWKTVSKTTLKNHRNDYEDEVLHRLKEVLPNEVHVTVLADRGFGDTKLYDFVKTDLGFDFVIRFRGNIGVTDQQGEKRNAQDWVGIGGRAKTLRNAKLTTQEYEVPVVVCVKAKNMKQAWCIAASNPKAIARELINWYAKRWGIESQFRDTKDIHFGMGLSATSVGDPNRRDRLLLISALAVVILTLLGAAGEKLGMDKYVKVNTVKRRTLSLFRQGCHYFNKLIRMKSEEARKFITCFTDLLLQQKSFESILWFI